MTQYWPFSGLSRHGALRERIIVSLDLGGRREALKMVDQLARVVGMFKIGKQLLVAGGPEFVREVRRRGAEVFLDLKFHDTPRPLMRAALEATRLGVRMFDVHQNGHVETIGRVRTDINRLCQNEGLRRPHVVAVAMLTGVARDEPGSRYGLDGVVELARQAGSAGLDGVFTSPGAAPRIRSVCGRRFIIVTTGARIGDGAQGPLVDGAAAIRGGADYMVVGSPIWKAAEPIRAVREIIEQIDRTLRNAPIVAPTLFVPHQR